MPRGSLCAGRRGGLLAPLRARRRKELILAVQLVDLRTVGLVRRLGRLALRVEETEDAVGRLLHQLDRGLVVLELDLLPRHALLDVELLLSLEDAGQEELAAEKERGGARVQYILKINNYYY